MKKVCTSWLSELYFDSFRTSDTWQRCQYYCLALHLKTCFSIVQLSFWFLFSGKIKSSKDIVTMNNLRPYIGLLARRGSFTVNSCQSSFGSAFHRNFSASTSRSCSGMSGPPMPETKSPRLGSEGLERLKKRVTPAASVKVDLLFH